MNKSVLHFSTTDYGGAGSAAYRLHRNLVNSNINSQMIVLKSIKKESSIFEVKESKCILFYKKLFNRLLIKSKIIKQKYNFYGNWNSAIKSVNQIENITKMKPDVVVLHWISGLVDISIIKELESKFSCNVYWYLMDMSPMTGGCHYAWDCVGYKEDCYNCPAIRFMSNKIAYHNFNKKKEALQNVDIKMLYSTEWLNKQLNESSIFKNCNKYKLMLGIDQFKFKPINKSQKINIKNKIGIKSNKKVVFFGCSSIEDPRKGFKYLKKSLELLSEDKSVDNESVLLLIAGNIKQKNIFKNVKFEIKYLGYLNNDFDLAEAYQVSDLYISPSVEDSGPMMVNESILSGIPVIAFNIGVALDLVIDGKTGFLVEKKNSVELAKKIRKMIQISDENLESMKRNCRDLGLITTSESIQLNNFISLLEN